MASCRSDVSWTSHSAKPLYSPIDEWMYVKASEEISCKYYDNRAASDKLQQNQFDFAAHLFPKATDALHDSRFKVLLDEQVTCSAAESLKYGRPLFLASAV